MNTIFLELPDEIQNKIYSYLPMHPVAECFDNAETNYIIYDGCCNWLEIKHTLLNDYRERTRKKPKHCNIIADEIRYWKRKQEYIQKQMKKEGIHIDKRIPSSFAKHYFEEYKPIEPDLEQSFDGFAS